MQIRTVHVALIAALVLRSGQFLGGSTGPTEVLAATVQEAAGSATRTVAATTIGGPRIWAKLTPAERQLVNWATERFALIGIDLPDVEVSFHDDAEACDWNEGIYYRDDGVHRAQICIPDQGTFASDLHRRRTVIHELAHAWAEANLDDADRQRLLSVLDAKAWSTSDLAWKDRGSERFAETIVWGLYDQLRRPTLIDVSCAELNSDFQLITGHTPLGPVHPVCAASLKERKDTTNATSSEEQQSEFTGAPSLSARRHLFAPQCLPLPHRHCMRSLTCQRTSIKSHGRPQTTIGVSHAM